MVLLVLIGMTLALVLVSREPKEEATRRDAGSSVRSGIVAAGLILAISLGAKLAVTLGAVHPAISRYARRWRSRAPSWP